MKTAKYLLPFILLSLLTACVDKPEKEKEAVRPVFHRKAVKANVGLSRTFFGVSRSAVEVNLNFSARGLLKRLEVKTGDRIKKGSLIAALDDSDYRLQRRQAVAVQKSAVAQLRASKSAHQRIEFLYEKNNVSLNEFKRSKASLESAKARFRSARSSARIAANRLSRTKLVAPFDGRVSRVLGKVGEVAAPGSSVVVLASENNQEVKTAVPKSLVGKIKKAKISFSTLPGRVFAGEVVEAAFASEQSGLYPVIVKILSPDADVRPGMTAEVRFSFQQGRDASDDAVMVPVDAVGKNSEGNFVFVVSKNKDGRLIARKRMVGLGELRENSFEITKGLKEGELIVTAGLSQMYDSREVTLSEQ